MSKSEAAAHQVQQYQFCETLSFNKKYIECLPNQMQVYSETRAYFQRVFSSVVFAICSETMHSLSARIVEAREPRHCFCHKLPSLGL
jgi:hypothetical protein